MMDSKFCPCCSTEKPLEAFQLRTGRPNGQRHSYCKVCCGIIGREARRRYKKTAKGKEAERRCYYSAGQVARRQSKEFKEKRAKLEKSAAVREYRKRYRSTVAFVEVRRKCRRRESEYAKARANRKNQPNKAHARDALKRAVQDGKLARGECSRKSDRCKGAICGHHHLGYEKEHWLDVTWLCGFHHWEVHHGGSLPNPEPTQR